MGVKAKAIQTLYRMGRITIDGVRQAVKDNLITPTEFEMIVGEIYE